MQVHSRYNNTQCHCSTKAYVGGSIGAIITGFHQNNKQLQLNIKDVEAAEENEIVSLLLE